MADLAAGHGGYASKGLRVRCLRFREVGVLETQENYTALAEVAQEGHVVRPNVGGHRRTVSAAQRQPAAVCPCGPTS